jgi:hypothetical protein
MCAPLTCLLLCSLHSMPTWPRRNENGKALLTIRLRVPSTWSARNLNSRALCLQAPLVKSPTYLQTLNQNRNGLVMDELDGAHRTLLLRSSLARCTSVAKPKLPYSS